MATATKTAAAKKKAAAAKGKKSGTAAKASTTKSATRKATRKATEDAGDGPSRAELRATRDAENTERMLEMREEGTSWSEIGAELGITPGKAQFLNMLHQVAEGNVSAWPKAAHKEEATIAAQIKKDRDAANEFSSWGWIAARSGISEPTLKRIHEEFNSWKPKTENIAIVRAEKNGETTTTKKSSAKKGTTAKPSGSASKTAKAKAKAKARGKSVDPS